MSGAAAVTMGKGTPVYIANSDGNQPSGKPLVITLPGTTTANDLLVGFMAVQNNVAASWAAGDASPGFTNRLDQGARPSMHFATRTDSGGDGDPTFTSSATAALGGVLMRWRLARFDVAGTAATISADGTLTIPGITSAGGMVIAAIFAETGQTPVFATPSGFTQIYNATTTGTRIGLYYKAFPPGATGAVTSAITGVSTLVGGVLLGLK